MRIAAPLIALAMLASCSQGSDRARILRPEQATPVGAAPETRLLVRTTQTISGQPVRIPEAPRELVVSETRVPVGGVLPPHKHRWSRYVYVADGFISVLNLDTGKEHTFGPGSVIAEAVDQWHEGQAVGRHGARLIAFDQVPPGEANIIFK
jgi:quercetin dioxygenase-like cupin family protein